MNDRDQRRNDRGIRVQTFGREYATDHPAGTKARLHFDNVDALLGQLDAAKAGQRAARVSKETLLDALSLDLQNLARTARRLEKK